MRKILFILFLGIGYFSFGQTTVQADTVTARSRLKLNGVRANGISQDSTGAQRRADFLLTELFGLRWADTGRANGKVATASALNKVRDSLQANITGSVSSVTGTGALSFTNSTTTPIGTIDTSWATGLTTRKQTRRLVDSLGKSVQDSNKVGVKVFYLSRSGIISDADLSNGSTTFGTNQTTAIQTILNIAADGTPIRVYWDVKASVTGLTVYSNTDIVATSQSYGAILRNNSNQSIFRNAHLSLTGTILDSNISIIGGVWNGNGANSGLNPAQLNDTIGRGWTVGLRFYGVSKLRIQDATIYNARTFGVHIINSEDVIISGIVITANSLLTTRTDGIHWDGYNARHLVNGAVIYGMDDAIGLVAEGNLETTTDNYYATAVGAMTDIIVRNVTLNNGVDGIRLLSQTNRMDRLFFENFSGKTGRRWLIANHGDATQAGWSNKGNVGSVTFSNINIEVSTPQDSANAVVEWNADEMVFQNIKRYRFNSVDPFCPTVMVKANNTLKSLSLDNYYAYDSVGVNTPHIYIGDSATVNYISVSGCRVYRSSGVNTNGVIAIAANGTASNIRINGITADRINYVVNNLGAITSNIDASNILHTNGVYTFKSSSAVTNITASNILGGSPLYNGTFTNKLGDAFLANGYTSYYTWSGTQLGVNTANTGALDYSGGTSRIFSYGPDASTIGRFQFIPKKSDGTGTITALGTDVQGSVIVSGRYNSALIIDTLSAATRGYSYYGKIHTQGGNYYWGVSDSTGSGLLTGNPYALNFVTESARDIQLGTNNTRGLLMDGTTQAVSLSNTLKIGSIVNATGNFATYSATGVLQQRTAAQVLSDIGAGSGSVTSVSTTDGVGIISSVASPTTTPNITHRADTVAIATRAWRQKGVDSLMGQINLKVNISDTSSMLANRLKISDTATMLSNRLKISDTLTMLSNRLKISDTLTMLSNRLKISDTSTMLSNLLRKTDTLSMLSSYLRQANNGLTKTNQIVTLGGLLNQNTTITDSTFYLTFDNQKKFNNSSRYGENGNLNMYDVQNNDNTQLIYAGTYGSMSMTSPTAVFLYHKGMYAGVNGTMYFNQIGNVTGSSSLAGVSGWNLFANTGNISNSAGLHIKTPEQQSGMTAFTGKVTTYGAVSIDNLRDSSTIQSKMQNMYAIYQKGAHDTSSFAGDIEGNTATFSGLLSANGKISVALANPDIAAVIIQATTGTNAAGYKFNNSGGNFYFGKDNSTGGRVTGVAYAGYIWNESNYPVIIGANNTAAATFSGTSVTIASLGTGTVYSNSGVLTNTNPSDSSLKNSIDPLKYGLKEVLQLQPKTFYYNSDSSRSNLKYGFIAQEVKDIMPDIVRKLDPIDPNSKLGLETDGIYVTLVNAIKEQQKQINELKAAIKALQK